MGTATNAHQFYNKFPIIPVIFSLIFEFTLKRREIRNEDLCTKVHENSFVSSVEVIHYYSNLGNFIWNYLCEFCLILKGHFPVKKFFLKKIRVSVLV